MEAKDLLPIDIELDEPCDPYVDAVAELEEAAQHLDLETWIVNKLRHCEREMLLNIPIVRDDGTAVSFTAFRTQHVCWRGPTLGAVSFMPNAHISAVRGGAMKATWQAALLEVPTGGAVGAIVCDPVSLSERELRQLARDYVFGLRGLLGRHSDTVMPGVGSNEQIMSWMLDAHAQTLGRMEPGTITGVPAALSGLSWTADPLARGVLAVLRYLLAGGHNRKTNGSTHRNSRVLARQAIVVQGYGPFGASIARTLYENGARITGVADVSGAVCNTQGLDIPALEEYAKKNGVLFGFPEAEPVRNLDLLESECDVLVTAATERQITSAIVHKIKAPVVVEATRSAITHAAMANLRSRDITVVPEILATAGGLLSSHLEWRHAEQVSSPSAEELDIEIERRAVKTCKLLFEYADAHDLTPDRAAIVLAVDRIAREMRLRR